MVSSLSEIAARIGARLIGDGAVTCTGANPLGEAIAQQVTLLDDPRRASALNECPAVAVVTAAELEDVSIAQLIVPDAHESFGRVIEFFRPRVHDTLPDRGVDMAAHVAETASIHPSALIGAGTQIGDHTRVMPGAVIMPGCRIGEHCVIHANVTIYEYTEIADRVVIHAGSVLGANGFGYRQKEGKHIPTAQLGYVCIESDVEIGACVTIDRGTYGATRVGTGTKIDNQVMIGHNCQIGRHNLLCSQVGIAGSCRTGDYVVLAGQVGLKDHITLGDRAIVGAQAGVMDNFEGDEVYLGSPATRQREQMQIMAVQRRLPDMRKELKQLQREVDRLQTLVAQSGQRAA